MPNSEIILGDCFEYIKTLPDNHFDIAIADPPYGIDIMKSGRLVREKGLTYKSWDMGAPSKEYFAELFRVSKNSIIWGANHFIETIPINSPCWVVWDKVRPSSFSFSMCELAFTTFDKTAKIFSHSLAKQRYEEERIHPTQKPIALYAWLLETFAQKGDVIFDPFLGSGSSRIAAYKLGFDFVGCEIDPEYYEAQEKRFRELCLGETKRGEMITTQLNIFPNQ